MTKLRSLLLMLLALAWPLIGFSVCDQKRVQVQVLGSGGPELTDGRASSGYLVRLDGRGVILVDAGSGSGLRFEQSGADFADVEVMLFSHLHTDHSADFPGYIKGSFFTSRDTGLAVFGPEEGGAYPSTEEFVRATIGAGPSAAYPYLNDFLDPAQASAFKVRATNVPASGDRVWSGFQTDHYRLSSVPVHHGPVPALAWRIDLAGCGIVFSGDMSGRYGNLPTLALQADLLVAHNAIPEEATGVARNLHMPPSVIGRLAAAAEVKKLVLSHRMQRTLGREQDTERLIRERYRGPLAFADDLDLFSLLPGDRPEMSDSLSYEERIAVTQRVFRIFVEWEIPVEDMPRLLGFRTGLKRRQLNRYRLGTPLPDESGVYGRIGMFLEIENALHKLFPHSALSANLWITTPRVKFGNETPLALMLRKDLDGIRIVRGALHDSEVW